MDGDLLWGLFKVAVILGILLPAVIYATRWYAKRQSTGQSLAVKEVVSLGANRALYIVEWENKRMLLGVTNQSVTVLEQVEITSEDEPGEVVR